MKLFKKNQIIIYVIALMLVTAGYLNYTTTNDLNTAIQTSATEEELARSSNVGIGDAQLVSSNDVISENAIVENDSLSHNLSENNVITNETNSINNTIETSSKDINNNDDYFSNSKLERDTMYSQMIETYEKVLNSDNSLETQKQSASEEITKINKTKNSIMICENLIKNKGFNNCIIFVNGDSISVIIENEELTADEVAQVQNIISREMNANVENIHISNK